MIGMSGGASACTDGLQHVIEWKEKATANDNGTILGAVTAVNTESGVCLPALAQSARRRSWIATMLWCVSGAMIAGTTGAYADRRGVRHPEGGLQEMSAMPLALSPEIIAEGGYLLAPTTNRSTDTVGAFNAAQNRLPYRGLQRKNRRQVHRIRPPDVLAESRIDYLRRLYLREYLESPTYQEERRELIEKAKKMPPGSSTTIKDDVHDRDGTAFSFSFLLYAVSSETTSGWWPFRTHSVTQTVYIKPLDSEDADPVELRA